MLKWIGGTALAVAAILLFMPQERWEQLGSIKQSIQEPGPMECLDEERPGLHDPQSAKYVRTEFVSGNRENGERTDVVRVHYQAKNGYGAVVQASTICALVKGHFDKTATQNARDNIRRDKENFLLDQETKRLKLANFCLDDRIFNLRHGMSGQDAREATVEKYPECEETVGSR